MKNKKNRMILGLVALVLVLGVGYAVVTGTDLFLNGTASVKDTELKVEFHGTTAATSLVEGTKTSGRTDLAVTTVSETAKEATFSVVGLEEVNDSISFTYQVDNKETDVDATLSIGTISNDKPTYFSITATPASSTVTAGGNTTIQVTVSLIKKPVQTADSTATFSIPIHAEPVAASS